MNLKKQTVGDIVQELFNLQKGNDWDSLIRTEHKLLKVNGIELFINWNDLL